MFSALIVASGQTLAENDPLFEPEHLNLAQLKAFIPKLQKGGYVIFLRHAATNIQQEDKRPVNLADCRTQRNLTDTGRQQARTIGQAFIQYKIPVGQVFNSPYCRCRDTAKLAFNKTHDNPELYFAMGLSREGKQAKGLKLRNLLQQRPTDGTNLVIVAHTANLQEAVGLWPKPEGVSYVFASTGNGQLEAVAIIDPATWAAALH